MVPNTGAPLRARQLRPLNLPTRADIITCAKGCPAFLCQGNRKRRIERVIDRWRIDDEWWRKPIRRFYYLVEIEGGSIDIFYNDLEDERWYRQRDVC